jgi:hypothetical protein
MVFMHGESAMEAARMETSTVETTRMETSAVKAAHPTVEAPTTTAAISDEMQGRRLVLWTSRHRRRETCHGRYCGRNSENSKMVHDDTPFTHPIWDAPRQHTCVSVTWGDAAAE